MTAVFREDVIVGRHVNVRRVVAVKTVDSSENIKILLAQLRDDIEH